MIGRRSTKHNGGGGFGKPDPRVQLVSSWEKGKRDGCNSFIQDTVLGVDSDVRLRSLSSVMESGAVDDEVGEKHP